MSKTYELKNSEVFDISEAINNFLATDWQRDKENKQEVVFSLEFKLSAILAELQKKAEFFEEARKKLQNKYAEKDDGGNILYEEPKPKTKEGEKGGDDSQKQAQTPRVLKMTDENKKKIQKDVEDLLNQKVNVSMPVELRYEDFVDINGRYLSKIPPNWTYNFSKIMV